MNATEQMYIIESMLDDAIHANLLYKTSRTCSSDTYEKQEDEMWKTRHDLLSAIEKLINKSTSE